MQFEQAFDCKSIGWAPALRIKLIADRIASDGKDRKNALFVRLLIGIAAALLMLTLPTAAMAQAVVENQVYAKHRGTDLVANAYTLPYTVATASSRVVLAMVYTEYNIPDDRDTLSVTLGGQPMTILGSIENTTTTLAKHNRMLLAIMPESQLPSGTNNLVVTYASGSNTGFGALIYVATLTGVDQSALPTFANFNTGCIGGGIAGGSLQLPSTTANPNDIVVANFGVGDSTTVFSFPNNPSKIFEGSQNLTNPGFAAGTIVYGNLTGSSIVLADTVGINSGCNNRPISVQSRFAATPVLAVDDILNGVIAAAGQANALNVLAANPSNPDTVAGTPATLSNVLLSVTIPASAIGGSPNVPVLDAATGFVSVPANTPAGTYTIEYQICQAGAAWNCDRAIVTITVAPTPIVATNDSASGINGLTGATAVVNAFTLDTINGVAASASNAVLAVASTSSVPAGLSFNTATGNVDVAAGTPAGTYRFDYTVCEAQSPGNCQTATIAVTVAPSVDLVSTKSNGTTSVFSGSTTTYTLTVTNNGPDAATGAVVSDTPGAGLTCPAGNPVAFSGSGAPSGSFTIADLISGITLGTLGNGQSVTLTYSCQVN
jgi:uncharacterized repeat protein (TIGR01451 family)